MAMIWRAPAATERHTTAARLAASEVATPKLSLSSVANPGRRFADHRLHGLRPEVVAGKHVLLEVVQPCFGDCCGGLPENGKNQGCRSSPLAPTERA